MTFNSKSCGNPNCPGCRMPVRLELPTAKSLSEEEKLLIGDVLTSLSLVLALKDNDKLAVFIDGCLLKSMHLALASGLNELDVKDEITGIRKGAESNDKPDYPPQIP